MRDALRRSFFLACDFSYARYKQTYKWMKIQTLLLVNFSLNLLLILGIPLLLISLAISWGIMDWLLVKIIVYVVFFLLVILGAYMSSFIRAFFAYYWFQIFEKIRRQSQ